MSNWCFIIPYRNREAHLDRFIKHYQPLFPDVPIVIVEQQHNTPFNRAKLMNVGFLEYGKNCEWAAYHDVDMYVYAEYSHKYIFPQMPTHLATRCEQFGYTQPYPDYSGGVTLINTEQMIVSNGFSNRFWSRNGEDDEMRNNLNSHGFVMRHVECYYWCEDHERHYDAKLFPRNLALLKQGRSKNKDLDGLTACTYDVESIEDNKKIIHLKVRI